MRKNPIYNDHRTLPIDHHLEDPSSPGRQLHRPILKLSDLKQALLREYDMTKQNATPQLMSLPRLSGLLKGFRPGELTIFTGPTGSGKTTVLSQISLDLCMQGMRTLWGSFEVRNTRLAQVMIQQIATKPIVLDATEDVQNNEYGRHRTGQMGGEEMFGEAYEKLSSMPMHFMNCFGSTSLESAIEAMELSVAQDQIQLIILDNLQFMLSGQSTNNFDKFDLVDQSIAAVRAFCNRHPVHVVLVIHPRKELDNTPLGLASVSGTAKATQEADNVIILQKIERQRWLEVKKNRFDGELGRVPVTFSRQSRMIFEVEDRKEDESNTLSSSYRNNASG